MKTYAVYTKSMGYEEFKARSFSTDEHNNLQLLKGQFDTVTTVFAAGDWLYIREIETEENTIDN